MSAARHWNLVLVGAVLVMATGAFVTSSYVLGILVFIALNAIAALGLSLVMGFAGQVSLGQAAFYAVGAYVSGVLTTAHGWNGWAALAIAVLAGGVTAFAIGLPIFRLSGLLLAMATLGFGIIVYYVLVNWSGVTGGPSGLTGIPPLALGTWRLDTDARMLWLCWGCLLLLLGLGGNLVESRIGRALRAVHGSEAAAAAVGIDTARLKVTVFTLAGASTALAGALYAHYLTFINPSPFSFAFSVELVVMVVIGGVSSLWGSVVGAALVVLLVEALRALLPLLSVSHGAAEYEIVVFGLLLMAVMVLLPGGLTGSWRRVA
ncbi:MAG TPA: branched-chain amino acid ABC transporter permease [Methylomirabilota bacterium]|nr:branched-chain amino acid ABC transporter permease [Methylomirabilota bacterium]